MANITFEDIKNDERIRTYIKRADETLLSMGYTEHSFAHVTKTAEHAGQILETLGYTPREVELAKIAGLMHDIGNVINRVGHAQTGAVMAFKILEEMGMPSDEVATVVSAIGNHDEDSAYTVNAVAAALILADKSDVRRSRVRNNDTITFDIHDRVNYAVEDSQLVFGLEPGIVKLDLKIDPKICPVMEYFEIFLNRMLLCRRAADYFNMRFSLVINGLDIM